MGKIYADDMDKMLDICKGLTERGCTFNVFEEGARWLITITGY